MNLNKKITLFFPLSLIFYLLHHKVIEMPKKAPMATTMAVFSMSQNLFGFLGSLMVRKLYF
ncbi:MAG: hypothetical protein E6K54_07295 [Gammaproteobacteria bacterium]|nr:MAG: hypothetical protein E6K54_07295 [Gammaproteobacteria bacterium]